MKTAFHGHRWRRCTLDIDGDITCADHVLRECARQEPVGRVARKLGRSRMACYSRLKRLGLTRHRFPWRREILVIGHERLSPHVWLEREYPSGDLDYVADLLGLTKTHLYIYAHRHGWRRRRP